MMTPTETKRCSRCRQAKPLDAFHKAKKGQYGRQAICKECRANPDHYEKEQTRLRMRAWYADPRNRAQRIAYNREWQRRNPAKVAEYQRRGRQRDPAKYRARWVKSKYKLTQEQYDELLKHDGICDSCGKLPAAHIDHCHKTGRYRGQLCRGCNQAAGMLGDDPVRATALAAYLVRVKETSDG